MQIGTAATHVMLDAPRSLLADDEAMYRDYPNFVKRAALYGDLIASSPVLERIARKIDVPQRPDRRHVAHHRRRGADDARARQLAARDPDHDGRAALPAGGAGRSGQADRPCLCAGAVRRPQPWTWRTRRSRRCARSSTRRPPPTAPAGAIRLDQLGTARGGAVGTQTAPVLIALTFMVVFALSLALLFGAAGLRRGWRAAAAGTPAQPGEAVALPEPEPSPVRAPVRMRAPLTARETVRGLVQASGDWPRTTRVHPVADRRVHGHPLDGPVQRDPVVGVAADRPQARPPGAAGAVRGSGSSRSPPEAPARRACGSRRSTWGSSPSARSPASACC